MVTARGVVFSLAYILLLSVHKTRRSKKVVGFVHRWFTGNIKYLYQEMENHKGIGVYFATTNKNELERLKSSKVKAYYLWDIKRIPSFVRTDVWVTPSHEVYNIPFARVQMFLKTHLRIQTSKWVDVWHGIRVQPHEIRERGEKLKKCDLGFVSSEFLKQRILSLVEADVSNKLRVIGFPRTVPLIRKNLDREEILKIIGIPSKRRNILYAPTWGTRKKGKPAFPWERIDRIISDIEKFCEKNDCNFLIRMHPRWNDSEIEQKEKLEKNMKVSKRIFNVPVEAYPDAQSILYISDVLITDRSTIANDFVLLQKPIIFLDINLPLGQTPEKIGYFVKNKKEFFEKLQESLDSPKLFEKERKKFLKETYEYLNGNSAKRCAQEIVKLLYE